MPTPAAPAPATESASDTRPAVDALGGSVDDAALPTVDELIVLAEQEVAAQAVLGVMYDQGRGVGQSDAEAVKWTAMAAKQGDAESQFNLGVMYAQGRGDVLEQSDAEAADWYAKAATQGLAVAQYNLGGLYAQGRGVEQSDADAVKWTTMAAKQGHADAQYNLGVLYEQGRGDVLEQSDTKAAGWLAKAADQGLAVAQNHLGVMYEQGRGVKQSATKAAKWITMAAKQGHAESQRILGVMYSQGRGDVIKQSDAKAADWVTKAADQGQAVAQYNLGCMYQQGRGVAPSAETALDLYRQAAAQGMSGALQRVAMLTPDQQEKEDCISKITYDYTLGDAPISDAATLEAGDVVSAKFLLGYAEHFAIYDKEHRRFIQLGRQNGDEAHIYAEAEAHFFAHWPDSVRKVTWIDPDMSLRGTGAVIRARAELDRSATYEYSIFPAFQDTRRMNCESWVRFCFIGISSSTQGAKYTGNVQGGGALAWIADRVPYAEGLSKRKSQALPGSLSAGPTPSKKAKSHTGTRDQ